MWIGYPLGDDETWPANGSVHYNIILWLALSCKREGKWSEVLMFRFSSPSEIKRHFIAHRQSQIGRSSGVRLRFRGSLG